MMGGPLFMSILSILLAIIVALTVWYIIVLITHREAGKPQFREQLKYVRSLGLFTLITGILGQLIGLFMAFTAIEQAPDISPMIVFGGLKISMITTLTGMAIYLVSIALWFGLDLWYQHRLNRSIE